MLLAIGIFIVGSVVCAMAPSMWVLMLGRALQGIGGGGLIPIAQTIIADMLTPRAAADGAELHLGGVLERQRSWSGARRPSYRSSALVVHLLDQSAAGRAGAGDDRARAAPAAAARPAAPARHSGRRRSWLPPRSPCCWRSIGAACNISWTVVADRGAARGFGGAVGVVRGAAVSPRASPSSRSRSCAAGSPAMITGAAFFCDRHHHRRDHLSRRSIARWCSASRRAFPGFR